MAHVGIRDLRDHLSRELERVRSGEELTVTDRGQPIARLVPVDRPHTLDRLIAEGPVTPATVRDRRRPATRVAVSGEVGARR